MKRIFTIAFQRHEVWLVDANGTKLPKGFLGRFLSIGTAAMYLNGKMP